jgi:hypothetical protein
LIVIRRALLFVLGYASEQVAERVALAGERSNFEEPRAVALVGIGPRHGDAKRSLAKRRSSGDHSGKPVTVAAALASASVAKGSV